MSNIGNFDGDIGNLDGDTQKLFRAIAVALDARPQEVGQIALVVTSYCESKLTTEGATTVLQNLLGS